MVSGDSCFTFKFGCRWSCTVRDHRSSLRLGLISDPWYILRSWLLPVIRISWLWDAYDLVMLRRGYASANRTNTPIGVKCRGAPQWRDDVGFRIIAVAVIQPCSMIVLRIQQRMGGRELAQDPGAITGSKVRNVIGCVIRVTLRAV